MSVTVATIPMPHSGGGLIEPSFADAIMIITAAEELTAQTRRHWTTSLRQITWRIDHRACGPAQIARGLLPARLRR